MEAMDKPKLVADREREPRTYPGMDELPDGDDPIRGVVGLAGELRDSSDEREQRLGRILEAAAWAHIHDEGDALADMERAAVKVLAKPGMKDLPPEDDAGEPRNEGEAIDRVIRAMGKAPSLFKLDVLLSMHRRELALQAGAHNLIEYGRPYKVGDDLIASPRGAQLMKWVRDHAAKTGKPVDVESVLWQALRLSGWSERQIKNARSAFDQRAVAKARRDPPTEGLARQASSKTAYRSWSDYAIAAPMRQLPGMSSRRCRLIDTQAARIVLRARVSFRTVSNVYAGRPDVHENTHARVAEAAREEGLPAPPPRAASAHHDP